MGNAFQLGSRRLVALAVLAAIGSAALPAAAHAGYAYDYGVNYDVPPWDELCAHNSFAESALTAASSQAARGHVTRVDDECRAVWAYNNLGVASFMNLVGHGGPARVLLVDQVTGGLYCSYLTSSFSMTGRYSAPSGAQPPLLIEGTSMVNNLNGSPAKLVVCHWCESGANPASGSNMLWSLVGYADVDCAVGFRKSVLICDHTRFGEKEAYYDWQYKYWLSLKLNYNADYSRTIARSYIVGRYGETPTSLQSAFGSAWGYGEHVISGDGNVRL